MIITSENWSKKPKQAISNSKTKQVFEASEITNFQT
jgi:hypothetical protein